MCLTILNGGLLTNPGYLCGTQSPISGYLISRAVYAWRHDNIQGLLESLGSMTVAPLVSE